MRYRLLMTALLAVTLAIAGAVPAEARMHAGPNMLSAGHRLRAAIAPPLDTLPATAGAYSFRKLRNAYAGSAVRLYRASDTAQQDIGFTGNDFNVAAAASFCAATTCAVVTWYDQSGLARHITAPGATLPYVAACTPGGLPCLRMVDGTSYLRTAAITWAAAKNAISVVAKRTGTVATCFLGLRGSGQLAAWTATTQWVLVDSGAINLVAAEGAWHAAIANFDGAASVGRLDGTETTGSVTGSAGSTTAGLGPTTVGTTCDQTELLLWDNYALTLAERAALTDNQRGFWGF